MEKLSKKDPDFYKKIGAIGGRKQVRKGYGTNQKLAIESSAKGLEKVRQNRIENAKRSKELSN